MFPSTPWGAWLSLWRPGRRFRVHPVGAAEPFSPVPAALRGEHEPHGPPVPRVLPPRARPRHEFL